MPAKRDIKERFWEKVNKTETCWLWTAGKNNYGHGRIGYEGRNVLAHRLSWEWANKRIVPEGLYVLHTCDVTACVNPEHLYVGDQTDNMRDMVERNRSLKGEDVPNAKLSEADVREIRKRYKPNEDNLVLAREFGVIPGHIYRIANRVELETYLRRVLSVWHRRNSQI